MGVARVGRRIKWTDVAAPRACARALALAFAAAAFLPVAPAGAVIATGLGDQNTSMFTSPAFQGLGLSYVRVVIPWDAALTGDLRAREWIETALARGHEPLVTFEKGRGVACPGPTCVAPSVAEYEAGVSAFRARWPQITDLVPWNEPNHKSQPTYEHPDRTLGAQYYNAVRRQCPACRLVAGDFLDDGDLYAWIADFKRALDEEPEVWGLHNYFDATYFWSQGVDTLLQRVTGDVWLTETGGIVRFSPPGATGLRYDETRAADGVRWLYSMTRSRSRVTRMYLYHWQGSDTAEFDAGLVRPDGTERLGLPVVREHLNNGSTTTKEPPKPAKPGGKQDPVADPPGSGGGAGGGPLGAKQVRVRLSGKSLRLLRRGLRVGVACIEAPTRCSGRVVVKVPRQGARSAARVPLRFDLAPGRSVSRVLPVSAKVRALIERRRRLQVTYCVAGQRACRTQYPPVRRSTPQAQSKRK